MTMRAILVAVILVGCGGGGGGDDEVPGRGEFEACAGPLEGEAASCEAACNEAADRWTNNPDDDNQQVVEGIDECVAHDSAGNLEDCSPVVQMFDGHLGCCVNPSDVDEIRWYECE